MKSGTDANAEPDGSSNIRGVLLCGGASRRMGSDKGLLPLPAGSDYANITWSERGLLVLRDAGLPVVLSINASQQEDYAGVFPNAELIRDSVEIPGPLRGMLSVHKRYPRESLLFLAVDMIRMPESTLKILLNACRNHPGHDAYVFRVKGQLEPLCAVYTGELLSRARSRAAPRELLESANTFIIQRDAHAREFSNMNSPDQLTDVVD